VSIDFWGDAAQVCTAVGGLLAGVATVGVAIYGARLWKATHRLAEQTKAANELSADAAWLDVHEKLRPTFSATATQDPAGDRGQLTVSLTGPDSLEQLDEMSIEIRNDTPLRRHGEPWPAVSSVERPARLWSRWRFEAAPDTGRSSDLETEIKRDETYRWDLAPTDDPRPGHSGRDQWHKDVAPDLKITITSVLHRPGGRGHMWTAPYTVPVTVAGGPGIRFTK
jgi:hypothetical protein